MVADLLEGARQTGCQNTGTVDCAHCRTRFLSVCAGLDDADQAAMAALVDPRCYPERSRLFAEDEAADHVFSITEGVVRLAKLLPDGRRQILGFALPGDFLGLSLAVRHSFSAEAVTSVRACRIPRKSFIELTESRPHLLARLHEMTASELSHANEQIVILGRRNAEEKVACFLLTLRERWSVIEKRSVTVPLPMGRQDIADYLGLTIETVSRTISKMARDRLLLVVPDGVRLLDLPKLETLARG